MTRSGPGLSPDRPSGPSRAVRRGLLILAVAFLAGHVPFVTTTPQEIDETNFVLGVRDFDVGAHRPHPPGSPVFVALGKIAAPVSRLWPEAPMEAGGPAAVEARALAIWGALFGALAVWPLFHVFRNLDGRDDVALAAVALTLAAPLYWFTAARPLSDVPGLCVALAAQGLLLAAWRRQDRAGAAVEGGSADRWLVAAAVVGGLATGLRVQALWLTVPLFLVVLAARRGGGRWRLLARCAAAFTIAVLAWAVPMIWAAGGASAYLEALRWQVRDDVAGVRILSRYASLRDVVIALRDTAFTPWTTLNATLIVLGFSGLGSVALAWRERPALARLLLAFAPYLVLHLSLHEISETRYALPLVPPTAYLAASGLRAVAGRRLALASGLLVAALLVTTLRAFADYVRNPSPVFAALADLNHRLHADPKAAVLATHQPFRRALDVANLPPGVRVLRTTPGREGARLLDFWLKGGVQPVLFVNDPRRGTLVQIDPASQRRDAYRWSFSHEPFLGGIRPDAVDVVELMSPPGWICAEGWALTPDTGGPARPDHRGPHQGPSLAHVRRRAEAAQLMIGGRHLAPSQDPRTVTLTVAIDGRPVASWEVGAHPDWFLRFIDLEAGLLEGSGPYASLTVTADARGGTPPPVGLEQFDLQSAGSLVWGYAEGWHEREFETRTGRAWRWTSERATLSVRAGGRDLTLRLAGESPLRYFDAAPDVTVRAGDQVLARLSPSADFAEDVRLPVAALGRSGGSVTIETSRSFVPAESGASPDRRRLGLRIFELTIR